MADVNTDMINAMPDDAVILDIGANHGRYTVKMATFQRKVYAFEPGPENLVKLRKAVENCSNVEVHGIALSNKTDVVKLMIHPGNPGGHSIALQLDGQKWKHKLENSVEVAALPLDTWMKENNIQRLDGIKIDVEAHEAEVLEGAKETLKKFKPILALETHQTVDLDKIKRILEECGYQVGPLKHDKGFLFKV